jgi:hypothetical protein
MTRTTGVLLLAIGFGGFSIGTLLARADGEKQTAAPAANNGAAGIDVQLAEVKLKLADMEYRRAVETNRRSAGLIPRTVVEQLQDGVAEAKERLELTRDKKRDPRALHFLELEDVLKIAKLRVEAAEKTNQRDPAAVSKLDLESLRLKAEAARLMLARAREPASEESPTAHLQAQIDQLRDEIQSLNNRVEILSLNR